MKRTILVLMCGGGLWAFATGFPVKPRTCYETTFRARVGQGPNVEDSPQTLFSREWKTFRYRFWTPEHAARFELFPVNRYNVDWSRDWQRTDDAHLAEFGLGADVPDDYYRLGLQRFLFGGDNTKRKVPTPDGRNGNPKA